MSLIGIHFASAPRHDGFSDYLDRANQAGSPFAAVMSVDQDIMPDIKRVSPDTLGIFRHQVKAHHEGQDDAPLGQGDPTIAGRNWLIACEPTFAQNPDFDYYSCTNELNPDNPDHHRWAAAYWLAQMQRADENHIQIVWGNFSTGTPDYGDWALYYGECLRYSARFNHVLGLHEYGLDCGAMRNAAPDLTLRYRKVYQYIVNAGLPCPMLLISECAPGSNVDDDLVSLKLDLEWYDAALMDDFRSGIPLIGACLYQWGGDEVPLFTHAMPTITEYVIGHPTVIAPPPAIVVGTVTTAATNKDNMTRAIEAANGVVVWR